MHLHIIQYTADIIQYYSSTAAVALAARQVPHHILHNRCPSYLADLVAFNGKLSTTSTQVVANQSCSRETDMDPIR